MDIRMDRRLQCRNKVEKALSMPRDTINVLAGTWPEEYVEQMINAETPEEIEAVAIEGVPQQMLPARFLQKIAAAEPAPQETVTVETTETPEPVVSDDVSSGMDS